jgi:poly-gamma-glutamate capsule biosynthesis protein CapA/YwtB (metallophosphatase superfamily)
VKRKWLLSGLLFLLVSCQSAQDIPEFVEPTAAATEITLPAIPRVIKQTPTVQPSPTSTATTPPDTPTPAPTEIPKTTFLFTGVIVPARCVQAAIDASGDSDYLYDEVRDIIRQADLAIGTLNATISDYPPRTGCVPTYVLVGGSENADALERAGFDLMSVATNHIKNCGLSNCGDRAFFDTLENLSRVGILPIGAGENLGQAMEPVVMEVNGVRFGFVSLGQLEPIAFAGEDKPGIAVLNEDNLRASIQAAGEIADVVIVMPHWGPEDVPIPNYSQRDLAQIAVDAGADLVVGNHTHVVQAIQEIDEVVVFYGLGNFVFDQDWARDHQQGVILLVTFQGTELVDYQLIPTHVDEDGRVHIAGEPEAAEILSRIEVASRSLP